MQEVWLDRISGKICMSISSKALLITNVEDRRHWNWFPTEESRLDLVETMCNYVIIKLIVAVI